MTYDNTNRGALFKNAEKANPKHADYNGNINVNGEEFWLNAWIKQSKNGTKYLSLSIKPKQAAAKADASAPYNDDIPFAPEWR
jgi:uncharacterized protein (DUF736 family)